MFASEIGPRDRDAQYNRSGIFDQLFSLLLNAGQDAVDQNHPAGLDPVVVVLPHAHRKR